MIEHYDETNPTAIILLLIALLLGLAFMFGFFSGMFYERANENISVSVYFSPYVQQPRIVPEYEVERVPVLLTAYSSTVDQTDADPFTMASGLRVYDGAVANNCLSFGTEIEIAGNRYEVQDRMNSRYGCEVFDIWMTSRQEALDFGKQQQDIYIIKKSLLWDTSQKGLQ